MPLQVGNEPLELTEEYTSPKEISKTVDRHLFFTICFKQRDLLIKKIKWKAGK